MRTEHTALSLASSALRLCLMGLFAVGVSACRQDMHDQPRYSAFEQAPFFPDRSSARPPLPGTVARGDLRDDTVLYTGKEGDASATVFPFPIDERVMARGQERFDIYCSPCHGLTGEGDGMIVQRGFSRPPSLIRAAAPRDAARALLRGHQQRVRRDARSCRADQAGRPMGDCRVYSCAPTGRIGHDRGRAARREEPAAVASAAPAAMPSRGQAKPRRGMIRRTRWGWSPGASE